MLRRARAPLLLLLAATIGACVILAIHFLSGRNPLSFPSSPPADAKIIGTNGSVGWGPQAVAKVLAGHLIWDRMEVGGQYTVADSIRAGFKVLAIVGNAPDDQPLEAIDPAHWGAEVLRQVHKNPGMSLAEAGNEMYLKGGVPNPVRYGQMYLDAVNDLRGAGINLHLLFDMWGDYQPHPDSALSADANGGGWLHAAVNGVPGLAAAILANGVSTHPYGRVNENYLDEQGIGAVAAQEAAAKAALGSIPKFYVTEYGIDLRRCGEFDGACSEADQAEQMHAAYEVLLSDPNVAGIWWYQVRDESIGGFGYLNENDTARPAFAVISAAARAEDQ